MMLPSGVTRRGEAFCRLGRERWHAVSLATGDAYGTCVERANQPVYSERIRGGGDPAKRAVRPCVFTPVAGARWD